MPKKDPIADAMTRLRSLKADPSSSTSQAELSKALASKASILLARAADVIREAKLSQFIDPMIPGIALTRLPESVDFLLKVIADEHWHVGVAAIDALRMFRADAAIKSRIGQAVDARKQAELRKIFEQNFAE